MYIPGFTNTLMRPDLLQGGPAYADMTPGAMPERASMLPFAPEAPLAGEAMASPTAAAPTGFQFMTDRGRQAGFGKGNTGFLSADPDAQYRMFDERGKNRIVSEGTGMGGLQNIYNLANQFNKEQGKKANWGIERLNPTTGRWERVAENDPAKNIAGKVADVALPTIGAILAGPLGAAAGSGLSSVAQGRSLENTLLRAAIAGGATYAGGQLFGPAAGGAAGAKAGSAASSLAGSTLGAGTMGAVGAQLAGIGAPIIVTNAAGSALGSALGSAAGSALGSVASGALAPRPSPLQQQPVEVTPEGEMVLTVRPQVGGALPGAAAGADAMVRAGLGTLAPEVQQLIQNNIQVEQKRDAVRDEFDTAFAAAPAAVASAVTPADVQGDPITVRMDPNAKAKTDAATAASAVAGALATGGILPSGQTPTKGETTLETDKGVLGQLKDRLGNLDAADYLRLAGVLLPLLDRDKGGRRGALGTIPSGMFGGSSVFSGSLPRATLPGASTGFAPRAPSALGPQTTQDYYRYGYGPAQSFFDYVPQGQPNTSQAFTGYEQAQAREEKGFYLGGMAGDGDMTGMSDNSFAVNGPGTGRSDEIPAMLSDGEYVIDAETVALLGDGSSKAGANILDQFRIKVRKDKGRDLVKGDFSANAKRPEHYLKGGRT